MNRFLTFLLGVILTIGVIFLFFRPNKEVNVSELEGDVRGIYSKLVELGYTQDLTDDDIQLVVEKIQEASNWIPQGTITSNDVVEGKTFYNRSRDIQTGTYKPDEFEFLGNANQSDVIEGKQFYSNSKELLTGTLKIPVVTSTVYKGDALVTDVLSGKKFYSNSGTLLTGTYTPPTPIDFTNMQYSTWDNYNGIGTSSEEDYQGDESEWSDMSVGEQKVWKDERTGVYWSSDQGNMSNIFTMASCDYFTSTPRSSYGGLDEDCGLAINYCANLDFAGRTNWYLPSQTELMQAYIDGMYNQAGDTLQEAAEFTVGDGYGNYWSSSEVSDYSTYAWRVYLYDGNTNSHNKTRTAVGVRCVSRD